MLVVYIACVLSAVRSMFGPIRVFPLVAAVANLTVLACTGWAALPAVAVTALAAAVRRTENRATAPDVSFRIEA